MCFSGTCPAEDYNGECTTSSWLGLRPCEIEEIFAEEGTEFEFEEDE